MEVEAEQWPRAAPRASHSLPAHCSLGTEPQHRAGDKSRGQKEEQKKLGFIFFFPFPDSRSGLGLLHSNWSMGKGWGHGFRLCSVESCSTINNSPVPPSSPTPLPQQPSVALFPSVIPIPFGILPYFTPWKGLNQEKIPPSTTAQEEPPGTLGPTTLGAISPRIGSAQCPGATWGGSEGHWGQERGLVPSCPDCPAPALSIPPGRSRWRFQCRNSYCGTYW